MDRSELIAERQARLDPEHQEQVWKSRGRGQIATALVLAVIMVIAVLDGVDVIDAVGVDDARVSARADDTTLEVRYPTVSRPALASPFEIIVTRQGGFEGQQIEVAVSTRFLMLWDVNGVIPSPAEESADSENTLWTFDPPDGDTLRIVYEARIEPAAQNGKTGRVAVLDDGAELVAVDFETRLRP